MNLHSWEALPKGFGCPPPLLSSAGHEILGRSKLETHSRDGNHKDAGKCLHDAHMFQVFPLC